MVKFLYLDDEERASVDAFIRRIEDINSNIRIDHRAPKAFAHQMSILQGLIANNEYNGIILDLKLGDNADWEEPEDTREKSGYNAPALAQEIRNRITEEGTRDFPIILWSTEERLNKVWKDFTGHDLFDLKMVKHEIIRDDFYAYDKACKMSDLPKGYDYFQDFNDDASNRADKILKTPKRGLLDPRISGYLERGNRQFPIHDQVRFILRSLLEIPNSVLIPDEFLAARLGIDISDSQSRDYPDVVSRLFEAARYTGPFCMGWKAWWFPLIEEMWESLPSSPGPLQSLTADERVEFISKLTGQTNLTVARPVDLAQHSSFWTICQATRKPLDLRDAFAIARNHSYPWQDTLYVSLTAILEGHLREKGIELDKLDEPRLLREKKKILKGHGKQ